MTQFIAVGNLYDWGLECQTQILSLSVRIALGNPNPVIV